MSLGMQSRGRATGRQSDEDLCITLGTLGTSTVYLPMYVGTYMYVGMSVPYVSDKIESYTAYIRWYHVAFNGCLEP